MKKICFLMETPFSHGGEQRVVSLLSNLLVEKKYDVSILCTDMTIPRDNSLYNLNEKVNIDYLDGYNNKFYKKIRIKRDLLNQNNLKTGKYKNNLFMQKFINCDLLTTYLLRRKINKEKYDIVISLGIYNKLLARVSPYIKAKTIGWQHSSSERYFNFKGEWFYNQDKYTKYMLNRFDEYVVLTNNDKQYIKRKFKKDVTIINNPKSIISNEVTKLDNKTFIAVGRFVPIKNFSGLIDIFKEFHKVNKDWKLKIVGDGYLKDEYIRKIKDYKLSRYIKIINYTKHIEKEYLSSSIYLMSSIQEGWGMVMSEAIEFGLPIISYDITSAPEMIKDEYNGYIIKDYNNKEFLNKMIDLSTNSELLKKFSENSRKFSISKSDDLIIKKWIKLFNEDKKQYEKEKGLLQTSVNLAK